MADREVRTGVTVGRAAELTGVTVRTLHHWDEIGLARPSLRSPAGYRSYTDDDLHRVQRIVAYRAAGLGLEAIREVVDDTTAEIGETLRAQRAQLAERMRELERLDQRLERLMQAHERGILLDEAEQAELFGPDWDPSQTSQARIAWGGSLQWAQFAERSATRGREEWRALHDAMSAVQSGLADALSRGVAAGSDEANELVERHREVFSHFFPLSREMQVCLGRMFEADAGFAAYYDGIRPGLASWFRQIIDASARAHGIDPDAAVWR
ncbi:MerR family transcriptional regulator [Microbacterium sp. XT11]|uniref:MerR family transcriptional regulator n=1 Tax=Microbacterium sp. XT11 TaxID=367477 RepID=UPI003FA5E161